MKTRMGFASVVGAALLLSCSPTPRPASAAGAEQAIRSADSAWAVAFNAKQLDAAMGFVAADGSVLAPNFPMATGTEAVRQLFTGLMALPDLSINWHATTIHVAQSGDLGYSIGVYAMSVRGPKGQPMPDTGKYATVWQKQTDGSWKVVMDAFNSDLPLPNPAQ